MQHLVTFTEQEWKRFRMQLASELLKQSDGPGGWKFVSREDGREISDRREDWIMGVTAMAFDAAESVFE